MHKLDKNRVINIAYIIEQVEEIVGVNDTIWNAVVFLSDQNDKMVFILPSVVTFIQNLNLEHQASQIQTLPNDNRPNKHGVITPEILTLI